MTVSIILGTPIFFNKNFLTIVPETNPPPNPPIYGVKSSGISGLSVRNGVIAIDARNSNAKPLPTLAIGKPSLSIVAVFNPSSNPSMVPGKGGFLAEFSEEESEGELVDFDISIFGHGDIKTLIYLNMGIFGHGKNLDLGKFGHWEILIWGDLDMGRFGRGEYW
jgi:hypothetical protein